MQPDDEHSEVIAAYAAGEDVTEIERRHGLTRQEIEWLVRNDPGHTPSAPNEPSTSHTPPASIVVAVVILAVGAAAVLAIAGIFVAALGFHIGILPVLVFCAIGVGICVSTARGLGQRRRGARITTIVIGVALIVSGGGATPASQTALPPSRGSPAWRSSCSSSYPGPPGNGSATAAAAPNPLAAGACETRLPARFPRPPLRLRRPPRTHRPAGAAEVAPP